MKTLTLKATTKAKEAKEKEQIKIKRTTTYKGEVWKIGKSFNYVSFRVTNNCKMKVFDGASTFFNFEDKERQSVANLMTESLGRQSGFFVHATRKPEIEMLKRYFKMAYCVRIPIGYQNRNQYHAFFYTEAFNYNEKLKKETPELCL